MSSNPTPAPGAYPWWWEHWTRGATVMFMSVGVGGMVLFPTKLLADAASARPGTGVGFASGVAAIVYAAVVGPFLFYAIGQAIGRIMGFREPGGGKPAEPSDCRP